MKYSCFTFRQVVAKAIELPAMPGPEVPPKAGLPGHKLGLEQKKDLKSEGGQARNQA